jgi:uncharacterized DUF497 family protein
MRYTWDPEKNRQNIAKHGIDLADPVRIFDGPVLEREDDRFDYGEIRVNAYGLVAGVVVLCVIYADRGANERRIISARKAEPHERRYFFKILLGD